jgi:hypothetical protein
MLEPHFYYTAAHSQGIPTRKGQKNYCSTPHKSS